MKNIQNTCGRTVALFLKANLIQENCEFSCGRERKNNNVRKVAKYRKHTFGKAVNLGKHTKKLKNVRLHKNIYCDKL